MTDDETATQLLAPAATGEPESNEAATAETRPRGRPFPKGVSGNPGGRAKMSPEVKESLRIGASVAAVSLIKIARDPKHGQCTRACEIIFDRLYGKAVAAVANPDGSSLFPGTPAGDSPLDVILARLTARRTGAEPSSASPPPEQQSAAPSANGEAKGPSPS